MEQKKATAKGKLPMVQNEWFHCEVQGHEKRQKLRLTRDQVINGSVCHAKESYLVMKVLEF